MIVLFVGASMGGFGAILHGGHLADAVVAFGPQVKLTEASLRPQGVGMDALRLLESDLMGAVATARRRRALMRVHCPADEYLLHALQLPLDRDAVVVHPLLPRKPFAKYLDKAFMLEPIIADAIRGVLERPPANVHPEAQRCGDISDVCTRATHARLAGELFGSPPSSPSQPAVPAAPVEPVASPNHELSVAVWGVDTLALYHASRQEILEVFYAPHSPGPPRLGDWFCSACMERNRPSLFFCRWCKNRDASASIVKAGRVPTGDHRPAVGDWGCVRCGAGMEGKELKCRHCGETTRGECDTVVIK